jgi:hypothetical protein
MGVRNHLFFLLLLIGASAQVLADQPTYLEKAGFVMTSASRLSDESLIAAIKEIESRTSLRSWADNSDNSSKIAVSGSYEIAELFDLDRSWETTVLFYNRENREVLFMRLRFVADEPEVRLWSQGPTEIVLSNLGIKKQLIPSSDTFRFDPTSGPYTPKISVTDALACLSKILGLSATNWDSAISKLTNLTCSDAGSVVFDAIQTLLHCFSLVSVGVANITSTAGCIWGATKLIGCGYLACSGPSVPTGLSASDGSYSDRVHVVWNPTQSASTYTLYRSQSPGSYGSAIMSNSSSTSYDDYSATPGYKYYYYWVKACSNLGCSDISGYDSGWRSGSSGGCNGGTFSGSIASGGSAIQPNGTFYQSTASGTQAGNLNGPSGSDFDLYLYKWNGNGWSLVASGTSSSSSESVSYSGTSGYYYWRVNAFSGSGSYSLCLSHP